MKPLRDQPSADAPPSQGRWLFAIVLAGAVTLGAIVALLGAQGVAAIVLAALVALGAALSLPTLLVVVVSSLLLPLDYMDAFMDSVRGIPAVVIVSILLALSLYTRRKFLEITPLTRSLGVFIALMAISAVATFDITGGIRSVALWGAGLAASAAFVAAAREDGRLQWRLVWLLLALSAAAAATVFVDRLFGVAVWDLIPGYQPVLKTLGGDWVRPSASLGQPLRLGTLNMLGCISGLALIFANKSRAVAALCVLLSASSLFLTAARGSWLGLVIAIAVMVLLTSTAVRKRVLVVLGVATAVGLTLGAVTGALPLAWDRLTGASFDPSSFAQRFSAIDIASDMIRRRPLFGYGFSEYAKAVVDAGLPVPSLENDYIGFALKGGLPVLVAFLLMIVTAIRPALGRCQEPIVLAFLALLAALAVNAATYNMFDWTSMPTIFSLVLAGLWSSLGSPAAVPSVSRSGTRRL